MRRNALEGLTACAGSWRGTNTLQDPNTGKPEESPSTVTVTPVLAGRFIRVDDITHTNIDPDGREELAAKGVYSRA